MAMQQEPRKIGGTYHIFWAYFPMKSKPSFSSYPLPSHGGTQWPAANDFLRRWGVLLEAFWAISQTTLAGCSLERLGKHGRIRTVDWWRMSWSFNVLSQYILQGFFCSKKLFKIQIISLKETSLIYVNWCGFSTSEMSWDECHLSQLIDNGNISYLENWTYLSFLLSMGYSILLY